MTSSGTSLSTTEERDVTTQKACCLIGLLVEKGHAACGKFISKLAERDLNLYSTLRLLHDSWRLYRMIPEFIKSAAVLEGLLKDMQEMKQLSDGEVEEVMKQESTWVRTSHLTSIVMRKGDAFRENLLSKLGERNPEFYSVYYPDLDPVDRLIQVQSQFVESVSDAVMEELLKDMLEMKVLSDEDVEEVRDAPQNTGLQSWLVEQINSGRYPGLSWTNEALKQFRIPWKHDDRKDLTPEDTMIFKGWAVATGCYREGIDQPDPAYWRRHFQRAVDKDECLVLRAEHSRDPVDPHKIYRSEDILADKRAKVKLEKTHCLISLLVEKGRAASGKFIFRLAERNPNLYRSLRLHLDSRILCRMILEFIKSAAVLEGLLKDMQEMKLLSDGEVEEVKKQASTQDRISHLTSMVMRKGDAIRENLLSKLTERKPKFYNTHGPDLDPVNRLMQVQSQFVERVSDAVMEGLLMDMLEMKVLSDEDVEEVRDAPQNTGLQSWLVEQINSGLYPGLSWTNEALKQFRIPWKHDDQKDLTTEDTMIFKDWAVATGRYREGNDQPDWRRHFQRALDKDEILVLRADHSRDPVDPHKIYWSEDILADKRAKVKLEKARCLISLVVERGRAASGKLISKLAERDPKFYSTHGPDLDPVDRLMQVQSQFVESVSDAVMEELLKDMLEMKVLSDEDVEEVRDAPQNTGLQPWLVEQINSGLYPGLSWTNEALKQFRIPWKHDDQKDLTTEDIMIFKDWAVATGRYREGIDQPDTADWRRHFQRALDKDEILVLRADHSRDPVDPHKIYWSEDILADKRAKVKLEKARCLISLLVEKGRTASGKFISKLAERDLNLYRTLRLHHDSWRLYRMIPEFIQSTAVLNGLLKEMQEMKQLSDGEVEEVKKQPHPSHRISHLTRMVMKKEDAIRENLLSKLTERKPKFYNIHRPDLDPVDRLIQVQSQFVESVSDAVMEGLLKDMLEMKVLSDEDVEEVRDAPQNTGLQSWLVEQINSGRYPGLSWTNEALKQFRIPWKHDDRLDLTPEDTMIFKDWAVVTGRYREGIDQPDPADWRRHFQRAMDKDECLGLHADHSRDPVDPHKIYWSEDILADKRAKVKLEKARCLISLLVEKERAASGKFISKLAERDLNLYRTLRLHHDSRILCHMIPEFIQSTAVLNGLLKEMQEMKLLSDGEVEEVKKQPHPSHRISHLTRMVMKKEDAIRENLLSKLTERKPKFYNIHRPDLDPVDRLIQVQSQFVESVSDAVMEGLLKDMLEMKVLSDEDVEEVRDAPQNTGLQSWLVEQINSGRYPGLSWTNEALKQFRIPWKHDDRLDLTPEDTMIFKDWAVVTGRYREGIDQPNPPDWRRHFQRAMDKDECLVLRADHSRDPVDPHKIYWSEDILADKRAKVKLEKARCLISLVVEKGCAASGKLISKLAERDPKFYNTHGPDLDPVDRLIQVQSQFVESVSDAVMEGLLKDMLEMKVLSDEDVEEVRDAPQNTGLHPWLVEQINSGLYPGLSWTNEALKQFRIPWKHDDQKDLTTEDTMIFKDWAVATGRYREGIDQLDTADWRRHFQRALDKDEILVLRADHSRDPVDPHKIYWSEDILADKRAKVKLEKARCLISLLVEKERAASGKLISKLAERDLNLYRTLRLHHDSRILCHMIPEFIESTAVLNGLLKEMQEMKLLSDGEVEEVKKQPHPSHRISHLTRMVMKKEDAIRENLLSKLTERKPKFYNIHRPDLDPVDRLMQVQSQFVESVSDAVMEGLLKDMLEMKVLSDEDVEEVRDAPQNTGLQSWLVEQINSGRYPGLSWTNEALKQFRIPWKHDDRKDLTPEDTMIFKDWAVVTGRYREGIDQPNPPDWRRHFQCAMDKDECLVLRADHSRDPVDPHKIYWSEDILADKRAKVKLEKACCLISLLVGKGHGASGKFIFKLAERNLNLYRTLSLHRDRRSLVHMIPKFIKSDAVLEGLLKDMQEMKQLSDGEVEEVKKQASTQCRASHLTRMVMKKGDAIRENFLFKLAERDPEFYTIHCPYLNPVGRLRGVQKSQFVESVSDAVMEGLLKDMLEMKVLSDEDVEEVRDAPQNTGLQSWLVEQINSGRYPGLSWTNEVLKQFRIPWKHDDRKDLTPEDTMIFKDWAVATGRYREGIDQPDPAYWRKHFQRALDKDECLVLRADHSRDPVDPHKIYISNADSRLEERGNRLTLKVTELTTFRPTIHHEGHHKYYRFSFKKEGEYQCEITALIFDVASPAEVVYGTEQWEKCPLDQSSLLPAGPLYDINSPSGALKQLSFPHSECSPEVQNNLMVAHYKNDNVEMIKPSEVTETHIKIKVTEMSLFGLVRRWMKYKSKAQVLLFLRQLTEIKKLNVFLLSSNIVLDDVQEKQKGSIFIETSSRCVVLEEKKYSVSCDQENANVQPDTYDFVRDYGPNFHPTFEIFLNNDVKSLTLEVFKSTKRDALVWSRKVWLDETARCTSDYVQSETAAVKPRPTPLQAGERLKAVRTRLIEGLNASVIRDLLDDMLHMNVLNDGEVESVKEGQTCTKDKASCLIDMVRKKGSSASEKLISKLAERDPVLYVTLGLHRQSVD